MYKFGGLLLIGALTLSGCAGAVAPTPTPTIAAPSYLDTLRDTRAFVGRTDASLNTLGQDICAVLKEGTSLREAMGLLKMASSGMTPTQAETVVYAAADEFCPALAR